MLSSAFSRPCAHRAPGIIVPALYYTNTWYAKYLPISSTHSFDNTGKSYQVAKIINDQAAFDLEKYKAYSPLFLSTTFALSYGLSFASITATITHTFLYFRKQIWVQARRSLSEQPDIHARLMSRYPQVPEWWYMIIFLSMFVFGVVAIEVWHTQMPVWALVLALIIGACPRICFFLLRCLCAGCSVRVHDPHRYDSGHHEPADRSQVRVWLFSCVVDIC